MGWDQVPPRLASLPHDLRERGRREMRRLLVRRPRQKPSRRVYRRCRVRNTLVLVPWQQRAHREAVRPPQVVAAFSAYLLRHLLSLLLLRLDAGTCVAASVRSRPGPEALSTSGSGPGSFKSTWLMTQLCSFCGLADRVIHGE